MDRIKVRNYRCFREKQTARLAPLTLLVGENSTGKTSFLALIRALWDVAVREIMPDFKEYPYDLGSFREISHYRGAKGSAADSFEAGFSYEPGIILHPHTVSDNKLSFDVTFAEREGAPFPIARRVGHGNVWVRVDQPDNGDPVTTFGASSDTWSLPKKVVFMDMGEEIESIKSMHWHVRQMCSESDDGDAQTSVSNWRGIDRALTYLFNMGSQRPFASAPVRSRPRRTYDPARHSRDPEGGYTPTYLDQCVTPKRGRLATTAAPPGDVRSRVRAVRRDNHEVPWAGRWIAVSSAGQKVRQEKNPQGTGDKLGGRRLRSEPGTSYPHRVAP